MRDGIGGDWIQGTGRKPGDMLTHGVRGPAPRALSRRTHFAGPSQTGNYRTYER